MLEVKYKLIPAGFWLRFVAYGIDTALILGGGGILILALAEVYGEHVKLFGAALLPAYYLYYAILESSSARATLGKRLFGLRVVDLNGRRLGFWQALGRNLSKAASQFIFGIGFLMAGWTEKKQALHDIMAGALVMKRVPVYVEQTGSETPLTLNRLADGAQRGAGALAAHDFSQYVGDDGAEESPDSDDDEEY